MTEILNHTFIFPLYIGSDKASKDSSLHLRTKSGNFSNTFEQMAPTYFSYKKNVCIFQLKSALEHSNKGPGFSSKYIKAVNGHHILTWDLLVPAVDLSRATLLETFLNIAK